MGVTDKQAGLVSINWVKYNAILFVIAGGVTKYFRFVFNTVLGQFMFEGVLLCFVAGVFSVIIGFVGGSFFASLLLPAPTLAGDSSLSLSGVVLGEASSQVVLVALSSEVVLFGLGVAVLFGVVGSLYPAWRASRIRPAEAMRYE